MTDPRESRAQRLSLAAILIAGAALRLWQYFGNASLWIDEIALAENVLYRPLGALVGGPLAFDQVAPPGFLALLKAVTAVFGPSELALRLFPLVASLVSLPLMAALARRVLGGWTAIFATGLFAAGTPFILHGCEVKQYSSDIAASLVLTLVALRLADETSPRAFVSAGLIGAVAVWFSQAAVLLLVGLGLALAWIALQRPGRPGLRRLAPTIGLWAAGAAVAAAASLHRVTPATRAYLRRFWEQAFPPVPPRSLEELYWLPRALLDFWRAPGLDYPGPALFFALTIFGSAALWRTRREQTLLLFTPVGVTLAAAAAREYPFAGRVILFLSPAFLLCAAAGARLAADMLARARVPRAITALLVALPPVFAIASDPPVRLLEETRPLLTRLAASRHPGDAIYVYYAARMAFGFYAPRAGMDPTGVVLGGCHREDPRGYLRELDALRSRPRVWIFFAHSLPALAEEPLIRGYLGEIGRRRQSFRSPGAALELYDLSDPARLAAASAETFPPSAPDPTVVRRFGCDAGPHAAGGTTTRETPP